jgi:hypothetical protein
VAQCRVSDGQCLVVRQGTQGLQESRLRTRRDSTRDVIRGQVGVVEGGSGSQARVDATPAWDGHVRASGDLLDLPTMVDCGAGMAEDAVQSVREPNGVVHRR